MQGAEIHRATSLEDLRQAFRLVHDAYVEAGYITPNPGGMRLRSFEAVAETAMFVAKKGSEVVGALGLVLDSLDLGLPSDRSFRAELDQLRAKGMKLAEGTNQAVLPAFRKTAVTTELIRCGVAQGVAQGCDGILVTVSPSHSRFYEMLEFRRASGIRSYSRGFNDPVVVMCLDTRAGRQQDPASDPCAGFARDFLFFDNPFNRKVKAWQPAASQSFYDAKLLRELFVVATGAIGALTAAEREAVGRRWGADLFAEVTGPGLAQVGIPASSYVPTEATAAESRGHGPR